jgi:hypothetical protein
MKKPTTKIKGWADGILQPDWSRLEEAHLIKRDPVTDEISWPPTSIEEQLKKAGLI